MFKSRWCSPREKLKSSMDPDRAIALQDQRAGSWLRRSVEGIELNSYFTSISLADNMSVPYAEILLDPFQKIAFPLTKDVRDLLDMRSKRLSLVDLEQKVLTIRSQVQSRIFQPNVTYSFSQMQPTSKTFYSTLHTKCAKGFTSASWQKEYFPSLFLLSDNQSPSLSQTRALC